MPAPYYPTGDALLPGRLTISISFPNSQNNWLYSAFLGVLYDMGLWYRWWEFGETTPDEAAEQFRDIFNNWISPVLQDIGDIKWSASSVPPAATWLLCDGSTYLISEYTALNTALAGAFNDGTEPPGYFRVPDLRGRTAVVVNSGSGRLPSWANTIGGNGGESRHTLTVSEMPSHAHADAGHAHSIDNFVPTAAGLEPTLASLDTGIPLAATGFGYANLTNTGGDVSHENVQPSLALYAYILYAVQ
jgi:microcystin-dependent protein